MAYGVRLLVACSALSSAHASGTGSVVVGTARGSGLTMLRDASGVALAANGDLLVADTVNNRILRCKKSTCSIVAGGTAGSGVAQLKAPYSVAVSSQDTLFIVDTSNQRVQRWDPLATYGATLVGSATGSSELSYPTSAALDEVRRHLYIADTGNQRIRRYTLDALGQVVGQGVTVAGVTATAGNTTDKLDNPTSVFYDPVRDSIWVADARNRRILRWPVGSTEGSAGIVEVPATKGRPYGVFVLQNDTYWSDYDLCLVAKRSATTATVIMAGTGTCGSSTRQLDAPASITLSEDGALYVADSGNSRVLRFGPEPLKKNVLCKLSWTCDMTFDETNPTEQNLLAVIQTGAGSSCGGPCVPAPLSGGNWTGAVRPLPPFLRQGRFSLGAAMMGAPGAYQFCWGAAVPDASLVASGDCSGVPFAMGTLTMTTLLDADLDGSRWGSQCVRAAPCRINITGYALNNGTIITTPPGSGPGSGFSCKNIAGATFTGYREYVQSNPGVTPFVYWPWQKFGNLTMNFTVDMGIAFGMGSQMLCVCYKGAACLQPLMFAEDAGMMRIRSALGGEKYKCQLGTTCKLTVKGKFLLQTDFVAVADVNISCTDPGRLLFNTTVPFDTLEARAASAADDSNSSGPETFLAAYDLGPPLADGRFKVCYCASYDGDDLGTGLCDSVEEFTQEAGVLEVYRVFTATGECAVGRPCSLSVAGTQLVPGTDRLLVSAGGPEVCGTVSPLLPKSNGTKSLLVNVFMADNSSNDTFALYGLKGFDAAGLQTACYCSTWDSNGNGPCNDDIEYYQVAVRVTVRGPRVQVLQCVKGQKCVVAVLGYKLSAADKLVVLPFNTTCGGPQAIALVEAGAAVLSPLAAGTQNATFSLGVLPVGPSTVCYCAPGSDPSMPSAVPCQTAADLTMAAGEVQVRGAYDGQLYSCVAGSACSVSIRGFELQLTDQIMIAPLGAACGNATPLYDGSFLPSPIAQVASMQPGTALFQFGNSTTGGRYRVCQCVNTSCANASSFLVDAGLLFVKGLLDRPRAATCQLGGDCSVAVRGFGLNAVNDSVILVPRRLGCGGSYVLAALHNVVASSYVNQTLLGTYRRLPTFAEGRPQYISLERQQLLYYNTYGRRWIMGPRRDPDIPQEPGWAWISGPAASTPTRDTEGSWQRWLDAAGQWVSWPELQILGAASEIAGVFGRNPSGRTGDGVPDPALGPPYRLAQSFQLGTATAMGAYRICYCPALDLDDRDELPCSGEEEYNAQNGMLVVGVLVGSQRFHCALGGACSLRVLMQGAVPDQAFRLALLVGGSQCEAASNKSVAAWASAFNISNRQQTAVTAEGVKQYWWDLGAAVMSGAFQVCVCTAYDDNQDGLPCNSYADFFQEAGALAVAPFLRRSFAYNVTVSINLTTGSGLAASDRLQLVNGAVCPPAGVGPWTAAPRNVSDDGSWELYEFGNPKSPLPRGTYSMCLCAGLSNASCVNGYEFDALVGRVTISVLVPPVLRTAVSSALTFSVVLNGTAQRRLVGSGAGSLAELFQIASALEEALAASVAAALSVATRTVSAVVGAVTSAAGTNSSGFRTLAVKMGVRVWLAGDVGVQVKPDCPIPAVRTYLALPELIATADPPDQVLLGTCLRLAGIFDTNPSPLLAVKGLSGRLLAALKQAGLPAVDVTISSIDPSEQYGADYQPPQESCAQDAPCSADVMSPQAVLTGGAVLALDGVGAQCGSLTVGIGNTTAASRAAANFTGTPIPMPIANTGTASTSVNASLGLPGRAGLFTLCYCMDDSSQCVLDGQFEQQAATLTVRGVAKPGPAECIAFLGCNTTVEGFGLGVWDRLVAIPPGARCAGDAPADASLTTNPASNPIVPVLKDGTSFRTFSMGVPSKIGRRQLCYCPSYTAAAAAPSARRTMPCQALADFSTSAGVLWVRGVDDSTSQYQAVRADDPIAPAVLVLKGLGLKPVSDQVMLLAMTGAGCGAALAGTEFILPNPIGVQATGPLTVWANGQGADVVTFRVDQATKVGTYRVCFCTASPDNPCEKSSSFLFQVGLLTVRGAVGDQSFMCREGLPCSIEITGVNLTMDDWVTLVDDPITCGYGGLGRDYADGTPARAVSVGADGQTARFDLGVLKVFGAPFTRRICYCANHSADGHSAPCTNTTDFAHSAGVVNTIVCPTAPAYADWTPPVQDVFPYHGGPHIRLWATEGRACSDQNKRSDPDISRFNSPFPENGTLDASQGMYVSTAPVRCDPAVRADAPQMNAMAGTELVFQLHDDGDVAAGLPLRLQRGFRMRVTPSLWDRSLRTHTCPSWQVRFVALACDWTGAVYYGVILHVAFLVSTLVLLVSLNLQYILDFLRRLRRRMAAAGAAGGQPGAATAPPPTAAPSAAAEPPRAQRGLAARVEACLASTVVARNVSAWHRLGEAYGLQEGPAVPVVKLQAPPAKKASAGDKPALRGGGDVVLPMLASPFWALLLVLLRVAIVATHLFLLFYLKVEDLGVFVLFVFPFGCIAFAFSIQFAVVLAVDGVDGVLAPPPVPLVYSLLAVSKLHLDITLPLLARKHQCELWRVAFVYVIAEATVQVLLPVYAMLVQLLPARRRFPAWSRRAALSVMQYSEHLHALPAAPLLATTATQLASAQEEAPALEHLRAETRVRQQLVRQGVDLPPGEPPGQQVATPPEARPTTAPPPPPGGPGAGPPPPPVFRADDDAGWATRCRRWAALTVRRAHWRSAVLTARPLRSPPETLQRRRLIALYDFMDASGWYVATRRLLEVIELGTGLGIIHMQARCVTLTILFGGMELATMHAFVLFFYSARLEPTEFIILILSMLVGVLQASRPGIGRASVELYRRRVKGPLAAAGWFLLLFAYRFAASIPLVVGCPFFTWAFSGWSVSVLFVELPLLMVLYPTFNPHVLNRRIGPASQAPASTAPTSSWDRMKARLRRLLHRPAAASAPRPAENPAQLVKYKAAVPASRTAMAADVAQELPPPHVLKYPGSEPLVIALFRLIETLSEDVRPRFLQESHSEIRQLQRYVQRLYELPPPPHGLHVREERMVCAGKVLRSTVDVMKKQSRPCRMAFDELRALLDEELHYTQMAIRSITLATSYHFRLACLGSRAEAVAAVLPEAPKIWLVHWRTLVSLGRLPDPSEKEFLVPAQLAFKEHGHRAVMAVAIHKWRFEGAADPNGVTCRQLVTFAHWYRLRWGADLEVHFWIDCCSLPELARLGQHDDEGSVVRGPIASTAVSAQAGMLAPVARRGLLTLQAWVEDNPPPPLAEGAQELRDEMGMKCIMSLETSDTDVVTTIGGMDAMLPLVYAAADAVVLCESRDVEKCAWVRLGLALARAFGESGKLVYAVDRRLVHIPRHIRHPTVPDRPPLVATQHGAGRTLDTNWREEDSEPGQRSLRDAASVADEFRDGGHTARSGFHTSGRALGNFFKDDAALAEQLAVSAGLQLEKFLLLDPTMWAEVHLERPENNRSRLARLAAVCFDHPAARTVAGIRRAPLKLGESAVHLCRLQPPSAAARPRTQALASRGTGPPAPPRPVAAQDASTSGSSGDEAKVAPEEDEPHRPARDPAAKPYVHVRRAPNVAGTGYGIYFDPAGPPNKSGAAAAPPRRAAAGPGASGKRGAAPPGSRGR